eukprot:TRINITY_DN688_c1_g1_i1.p1 TRINITY_DN688_c1_g1~~TRINITY_DN688_c1_g1_i1.p1  ORF type:complete len:349 (+),score=139.78 TRINITY_DN688_c1_g1_i1:42-1088(+)
MLARALLLTGAAAAAAAAGCTRDEDCSLNGVCNVATGACACDRPWTGPSCGVLAFKPWSGRPAYGSATNGSAAFSTWGGVPVEKDGKFHLYVARIPAVLQYWTTESVIDYAVADTVEGPYEFQSVVLPAFAHNPQIVQQKYKNGTEKYVLFHIGHGGIHVADAPSGPFTDATPKGWSCNNPAPWWAAAEETWYIVCPQGILTAKDVSGPWSKYADYPTHPPSSAVLEDPYLYQDQRGNWHAVFHAYDTSVFDHCGSSPISGHSFSRDLKTWSTLPTYVQPYDGTVRRADGTDVVLSTLERPKFVFDGEGRITHLFNGAANVAECNHLKPCVDCKYLDYTMTLARALDV